MKTFAKILLATAATAAIAMPAGAATVTTTFPVSASVVGACSISASALSFGVIQATGQSVAATTTMQVLCTTGLGYTVTLNNGSNALGAQRRMTAGGAYIPYQLYTDNTFANIWNATSGANVKTGTGSGSPDTLVVYGQIPANIGSPPTGTYSDTITAVVTY